MHVLKELRIELGRNLLVDESGRIRFTKPGKEIFSTRFAGCGISLESIRSLADLSKALTLVQAAELEISIAALLERLKLLPPQSSEARFIEKLLKIPVPSLQETTQLLPSIPETIGNVVRVEFKRKGFCSSPTRILD
jgi:hypothetical protein